MILVHYLVIIYDSHMLWGKTVYTKAKHKGVKVLYVIMLLCDRPLLKFMRASSSSWKFMSASSTGGGTDVDLDYYPDK